MSNKFIEYIKQAKINLKYKTPKFKEGDIIRNTKFKIVARIISIENSFKDETGKTVYKDAFYKMKDLENKNCNPKNKGKFPRQNFVHRIDATYEKVNPKTAKILYGDKL